MLSIELRGENGRTKKHNQGWVSARKLRNVLEVYTKLEEEPAEGEKGLSELEQIDMMIDTVANLFDSDEVTSDTILDGVPSTELFVTLSDIMTSVMGDEEKKLQAKANLDKVTQ